MSMAELESSVNAHQSRELVWSSRPFAELVRLGWPIAVATLSFTVMTLVDTLIVARLGTAELAGVGLGGTAIFFLFCFSFGLLQGVKVLVSQAIGAGRRDEVRRHVAVAMAAALLLGILTIGVAELVAQSVAGMTATDAAGRAARTYMRIRALGAPIVLVQVALREVLQAQGNTRAPMVAALAGNVVNVALALFFVFGLRMGVAGAAAATLVAHSVEAAVVIHVQRSIGGFGLLPAGALPGAAATAPSPSPVEVLRIVQRRALSPSHWRQLLRVGLPTGLQFLLEVGSFATLTLAVASFSEADMAAHQIALQLVHFSFMPCVALGEAASVLVGQAVGADRDDLVRYVGRRTALLAMAYAGLCSCVFLFAGRLVAAQFSADLAVVTLAVQLLFVAGLFGLLDAVNIVGRCVLRGTGDVRFAAGVGVTVAWVCTPTLAWGLGHGLGMGALGGWIGIAAEVSVTAVLFGFRVERLGWLGAAAAARRALQEHQREPSECAPFCPRGWKTEPG
ncbi:MAG: polysaccharide biosynthesis C-terminal domain-containing protein [Polyangiaceae bacterium]|nr:polysaccharide biosynthesis C-terminal domain-containing protein [Polyangiaceae bacterium]